MARRSFTREFKLKVLKQIEAGTPLNVLQELGGWPLAEMVRRYVRELANLCPESFSLWSEEFRICPTIQRRSVGAEALHSGIAPELQ